MPKAVLSKFLVDRIHKDWIDKLFKQGWEVEKGEAERGHPQTDPHHCIPQDV